MSFRLHLLPLTKLGRFKRQRTLFDRRNYVPPVHVIAGSKTCGKQCLRPCSSTVIRWKRNYGRGRILRLICRVCALIQTFLYISFAVCIITCCALPIIYFRLKVLINIPIKINRRNIFSGYFNLNLVSVK